MAVDADTAARAMLESWDHLCAAMAGGWTRREAGALAATTGIALPTLNGVWVEQVTSDGADVTSLLDDVAASGLPYCLQFRPNDHHSLADLVARREMTRDEDIPLMVVPDQGSLVAGQQADNLVIRQLPPAEASLHARLSAIGFEVPEEDFLRLLTPEVLAAPGVRCYVGEIDGTPVTTGMGVTIGPYVAVFNIATPPEHRRRGYGAAVTVRAVVDGFTAGAEWSWLQASTAGFPVYERLGFRTVEDWHCWLSPE